MVYGGNVTSTTVKSLVAGTYYVRVRTFKTVGNSKTYSLASSALTVTVGSSKPTATMLTKVTGGNGSFTATWNVKTNVDGYALQYAADSSFTSCKTVMVYGASAASKTVNGLTAGTYYVRVRTFKTVDGSKTYSFASAYLAVTVKKAANRVGGADILPSRPLTPPCVPFGTRRFPSLRCYIKVTVEKKCISGSL